MVKHDCIDSEFAIIRGNLATATS